MTCGGLIRFRRNSAHYAFMKLTLASLALGLARRKACGLPYGSWLVGLPQDTLFESIGGGLYRLFCLLLACVEVFFSPIRDGFNRIPALIPKVFSSSTSILLQTPSRFGSRLWSKEHS